MRAEPGYEGRRELRVQRVDDPMAPARPYRQEGKRYELAVIRNVRESAFEHMVARGNVTEPQREAGNRFRALYEAASGGLGAVDYAKEPVDGTPIRETLTERKWRAGKELAEVRRHLGITGYVIVQRICGEGCTIGEAATFFGTGERAQRYVARRFKECLDDLVVMWSLGTRC